MNRINKKKFIINTVERIFNRINEQNNKRMNLGGQKNEKNLYVRWIRLCALRSRN